MHLNRTQIKHNLMDVTVIIIFLIAEHIRISIPV